MDDFDPIYEETAEQIEQKYQRWLAENEAEV